MQREQMGFDVLIVGAGPAGLAAACHLKQCATKNNQSISVCVLEKASTVGGHILSGALIDTKAIAELFPHWQDLTPPPMTLVAEDTFYWLTQTMKSVRIPGKLTPKSLHNQGMHLVSLGQLCQWLAKQAEALGVEIFTGIAAQELLLLENQVQGVITGDLGRGADGHPKANYMQGMAITATYTLLAEGSRGHLGKAAIRQHDLDATAAAQHYALGFKEIWQVPASKDYPLGKVIHTAGFPLQDKASGGGFIYFAPDYKVTVGLVVDLNYQNPLLSPFDEFQLYKTHPMIADVISGGTRLSYGARALTKGGLHSLPKMTFPGGALIGCNAGTLNGARLKGTHTAIKSGLLAAQAISECWEEKPVAFSLETHMRQSWLHEELFKARNFVAALHRWGNGLGGAYNWLDQGVFSGRLPWTVQDTQPDHAALMPKEAATPIVYPKADGHLTFDRASSVFLSNIKHDDDQPNHLLVQSAEVQHQRSGGFYGEPAQRYCPAGVYDWVDEKLVINSQNCIHCKTCDIKEPCQNIVWIAPEGGSGPNYTSM
jgi:electron-transferring-flavoprotein dehydrogenase